MNCNKIIYMVLFLLYCSIYCICGMFNMNYSEIKNYDIANGPGVRTSLFVSGCTHHCKGCFNPETWDFNHGKLFTEEVEERILSDCAFRHCAGLTLLGGEPFEIENQRGLISLVRKFKERFPQKNIWCYTGYTLETDLLSFDGVARCEVTDEFLSLIDVLVDGEFILEEKDITLKFRGSRNQRILELKNIISKKNCA